MEVILQIYASHFVVCFILHLSQMECADKVEICPIDKKNCHE